MRMWIIIIATLFLAGCSHHRAPPPNARLSDSITVIAELNDQLRTWHGTPYRYGGMSRRGVDCSAFVLMTFRDRFALRLPRQTREQAEIGTRIDKPVPEKMVCMSVFMTLTISLSMPLPARVL